MHEKRYQVFISSTFEDLKAERRAVQDVVISTGDFPVQMESFPAADEDQFSFIKSLIDKCDYYVLIIAGRYGTASKDGLSYTHKEFRYAVSKGVPVLVMLFANRGKIPAERTESTDKGKERLAEFIKEAETGRLRKTWETIEGLKLAVREALDHAKATQPRIGWVRGDSVASLDTLEELNQVRKQNSRFREMLGELEVEVSIPAIPPAEEAVEVDLLPHHAGHYAKRWGSHATISGSWIAFFPIFYSNLVWHSDLNGAEPYWVEVEESCVKIGSALAGEVKSVDTMDCFKISKGNLERLSSYYIEAGFMHPESHDVAFTDLAKRLARRHRINRDNDASFLVTKGEVTVQESSSVRDLNDEIPF